MIPGDPGSCILLAAMLGEGLLTLLVVMAAVRTWREYRRQRREGRARLDAWEGALGTWFSPRIARLIMLEPRLYHALLSFRRRPGPDAPRHFATGLNSFRPLLYTICGLCTVEILLVSLALPNDWLFWKLLHGVVSLWAVVWLLGYYRALQLYRHQVTGRGIILRLGVSINEEIGWTDIRQISRAACSAPGYGPRRGDREPDALFLAAGDKCNICMELARERVFTGWMRPIKGIRRLYLSLEKPEEFLSCVQAYQSSRCPFCVPVPCTVPAGSSIT